jgi:hypothetical protein
MIYLDLDIEPFDQSDDLWWFFHLHRPCQQQEYQKLVAELISHGLHLRGEQVNDADAPDIFQAVLDDKQHEMQMTLFSVSDAPHLFLGTRSEYVIPTDMVASRLRSDVWLEYGKVCWRLLRPLYGFAENLNVHVERDDIERHRLTHITWAQFFSSEFVRSLGREVLRNAPAWRNENLGDDEILYVLSSTPYQYRGLRQYWKPAREYFKRHLPGTALKWSDMPG